MKIVYNIFVKVRKLWDAIFGKNGDGSEVKLAGTIDGATEKVELGEGLSLDGNTLSAEAGGTEVEPLANVSGGESIFRGLKINGVDYQGATTGVDYLTTAPTADNTNGIKIVVLSAEPATKYAGYLYLITA